MTTKTIDEGPRPANRPTLGGSQMTKSVPASAPMAGFGRRRRAARCRRALGIVGAAAAVPFFVWLPLGWLEFVPSMVDVFGVVGLRTPAGITIGGLLLAAIGFYDD